MAALSEAAPVSMSIPVAMFFGTLSPDPASASTAVSAAVVLVTLVLLYRSLLPPPLSGAVRSHDLMVDSISRLVAALWSSLVATVNKKALFYVSKKIVFKGFAWAWRD